MGYVPAEMLGVTIAVAAACAFFRLINDICSVNGWSAGGELVQLPR